MATSERDKNASTPVGIVPQELPAPRDITTVTTPDAVLDAIHRQFDAGATAVVIHDHAGRTARITAPADVTTAGDCIVLVGDDGATATVPATCLTVVAGTDADLAAIPLGTTVTVSYDAQHSQHGCQERTGDVVDWVPKRAGSVYKIGVETSDGDRYYVWVTGCVEKGHRYQWRKVGANATIDRLDTEGGDA